MQNAAITTPETSYAELHLAELHLNPNNARKFDENMTEDRSARFMELVNSIRAKGVVQPISVRHHPDGGYEVIAGERRVRACRYIAEKDNRSDMKIPAVIRECDDEERDEIMLIENAVREDLSPLEQARGFKAYMDAKGDETAAIAELSLKTGKTEQSIRRQVTLLSLPEKALEKWESGDLSLSHLELLSRLSNENEVLAALTKCLQERLSAKELRTLIETRSPSLADAKFSLEACARCAHNSLQQGSLFLVGSEQKGKCHKPSCFEKNQGEFFQGNWSSSKGRQVLQTSGFRFEHRLDTGEFQVINVPVGTDLAERCQNCPECVSVVRLNGEIVMPKARICLGDKNCYDTIYLKPAREKAAEKAQDKAETSTGEIPASKSAPKTEAADKKAGRPGSTVKADGANLNKSDKRAENRSDEHRKRVLSQRLPETVAALDAKSTLAIKFAIAALAMSSHPAAKALNEATAGEVKGYCTPKSYLQAVLAYDKTENLLPLLRTMAWATFNDKDLGLLDLVSDALGYDLAANYELEREYLTTFTKEELVSAGEESGMFLWEDEKIIAYRDKHFPKKGWMSLKKGELLDCIFKSGADLKGRMPKNLIFTRKP